MTLVLEDLYFKCLDTGGRVLEMPLSINGTFFVSEPERLGMIFSNTIFEAHTRTVLFTAEQIRESWRPGIDKNKLFAFKNLVSSSIS